MRPRSLTYRAEIVEPILISIAAGECCSIVGINGIGKTNLIQQLQRAEVLEHYLGEQAATIGFVVFDANMLTSWDTWGFFEGLTEALLNSLDEAAPADLAARFYRAHDRILAAPGTAATALRACAEVLDLLCARRRLVLIFDEIDPLFAQLPGNVLRNLRGLRDRHKYRLMYLTCSRQPLLSLRDETEWNAIEPFVELLTLRELALHPLNDPDAMEEIERFAGRHAHALAATLQSQIVALSGGHPALLRALTQEALLDERLLATPQQLHALPSIRLECTKIWQQLTGEELEGVVSALYKRAPDGAQIQTLVWKGLLCAGADGSLAIFSPIFADYVASLQTAPASAPQPIKIDTERRTVHYYGRDISSSLSRLEYRLLTYLWEYRGQIRPVEEVANAIYAEDEDKVIGLDRMRSLARRLKARLEQFAPDQPVPLLIYQSRGYRLGWPDGC